MLSCNLTLLTAIACFEPQTCLPKPLSDISQLFQFLLIAPSFLASLCMSDNCWLLETFTPVNTQSHSSIQFISNWPSFIPWFGLGFLISSALLHYKRSQDVQRSLLTFPILWFHKKQMFFLNFCSLVLTLQSVSISSAWLSCTGCVEHSSFGVTVTDLHRYNCWCDKGVIQFAGW